MSERISGLEMQNASYWLTRNHQALSSTDSEEQTNLMTPDDERLQSLYNSFSRSRWLSEGSTYDEGTEQNAGAILAEFSVDDLNPSPPRIHVTPEDPSAAENAPVCRHSTFWPEGICTWRCIDRCTLFILSIVFTIVAFVGGIVSLHYFERPVGWALMCFSATFTGIVLIRKSLLRLCCP